MITFRPIRDEDIPIIKNIIHTVAYNIFGFDGTYEDSVRYYSELGVFHDLDDVQETYFDSGGTFLAVLDGEQVIGSGALQKVDSNTVELKRMWLLEAYHGQGIGYRLINQLFSFSRGRGMSRIILQTSPEQVRAINFYRKIGFYEIPCYNDDIDEISMEYRL